MKEAGVTANDQVGTHGSEKPSLANNESIEPSDFIHGKQLIMVLTGISVAVFLVFLDVFIITTAIPRITQQFSSLNDIAWYGAAYQMTNAAMQPIAGNIYNKFSCKWSFMVFFSIFEIGSLVCATASSSSMLIAGRTIAGMGSSGILNGGLTIIGSTVEPGKRDILTAVAIGTGQVAMVIAPVIGGALTENVSWRWCFYINLPIGLLVFGMAFVLVPEQLPKAPFLSVLPRLHHDLDLVGFALCSGSVVSLLLALEFGGDKFTWKSSVVIGLFCGSGIMAIVFLAWNHRLGENALLPETMVKIRIVWVSSVCLSLLLGILSIHNYFLPVFFQGVQGVQPLDSGLRLLPGVIAQLLLAIAAAGVVGKNGIYLPWLLSAAVFCAVGSGLLSTLSPRTSKAKWIGYQIIAGAGRGMGAQMPIIATQSVVSPSQLSLAMSLLVFGQYMGASIFLTIANTIFRQSLTKKLGAIAGDSGLSIVPGDSSIAQKVPPQYIPSVLQDLSESIGSTFILAAALSAALFVTSFGIGIRAPRRSAEK